MKIWLFYHLVCSFFFFIYCIWEKNSFLFLLKVIKTKQKGEKSIYLTSTNYLTDLLIKKIPFDNSFTLLRVCKNKNDLKELFKDHFLDGLNLFYIWRLIWLFVEIFLEKFTSMNFRNDIKQFSIEANDQISSPENFVCQKINCY